MRSLEIDPQARTAWVEPGLTAGEYTTAADAHGLATGFGDTGSVGIGGITLAGGVGYLVRKYGLTIDSLLAADIITADGQLLRIDPENHPDLFWAIRGGGGNFGVVTCFKFQLHELGAVTGGMLVQPATAQVIADFMAEAEAAPDELSAIANVMTAPPMPFLPKEAHGKLILMAMIVHAGDAAAGESALQRFRKIAPPLADMLRPMRYPEIYPPEEQGDNPLASFRTMFMDTIDQSVAQTMLDHLASSRGFLAVAQLRVLGGAMARVPADATAFAHRASRIMVNVATLYDQPEARPMHEAWASEFAEALQQQDTGAYTGFLGDEGEERVRAAYPQATWKRLAAIKARYDPTNLFHLNQNIPPAG
jgi:FAD/FMN-containing dehydrogenase